MLGLDLRRLGTPELTYRRLHLVIDHLPQTSALARAMGGGWTQAEHLLAGVFDVLNWANYQRSGCKGSKPRPLERPGPKKKPSIGGGRMTLTQAREKEARRQELLREKVE